MRFTRAGVRALALAATGAVVAACSGGAPTSTPAGKAGGPSPAPARSSLPGVYGRVPAPAAGRRHAGTITVAQPPNAKPTWILPMVDAADNSVFTTALFGYFMWRPLLWTQTGVTTKVNPKYSLASYPVVSGHGTTYTVHLKHGYRWSDGTPVTASDVVFWFDLLRAAVKENPANWANYTPGIGLPDQVASVTAANAATVVVRLKSRVNPAFFIETQLAAIQPMPAQAWARASAHGPLLDYRKPANAKKIYDHLRRAARNRGTYAGNPLWRTVDGPYVLRSFNSHTGAFTLVPNTRYGGPHATAMSRVASKPYASDSAEYRAVRAGTLDVGYVPLSKLPHIKRVTSSGYHAFGYPGSGWLYVAYNFKDTAGHFNKIISQLYLRQALAHLQNQPREIRKAFHGAAAPAYGPLPSLPKSPYTPRDARSNPYPYGVAKAVALLKAHGWKVVPGGTDTCVRPGRGAHRCGAGIPAGTKLSWKLVYATSPSYIRSLVTALASQAKKAGIELHLTSSSFNHIVESDNDAAAPKNRNAWAMADFGGFTNAPYPTTFSVFNCKGSADIGGYCDPKADHLIHDSVFGADRAAVRAEAAYLTSQQPGMFQPVPSSALEPGAVLVWRTSLTGPVNSFASLTQYYANPETWSFTK